MDDIVSKKKGLQQLESGISKKFLNEVTNPSIDLAVDYSELFIDDIIESGILKEVPIVKSIVGVISAGISINQFWFAKKILIFIREFNSGKVSEEKLNLFREKLNHDPKFGKKIAEKLMVAIERNTEITQTKVIANLFTAYIEGNITFEELSEIISTLDKLNPISFSAFFDFEKFGFRITSTNHEEVKPRNFEMENLITTSGFGLGLSPYFAGFDLTLNGYKLFKYGIKPLEDM